MNKTKNTRNYQVVTIIFLLAFIISLTVSCTVRTQPTKVWQLREKMVTLTKSLIGTPYKFGGEDIDGFDCSGLVVYVYDCFGIQVPRTAKKQAKLKPRVKLRNAQPGDILVFKLKRKQWHAGIIVDKNHFVHAPKRHEPVRQEVLDRYWRSKLVAVVSKIK